MGRSRERFLRNLRCTVAIATSCIFLGFCLQFIATVGPAWFIIVNRSEDPDWQVQEGIWLARFCDMKTTECFIGERLTVLKKIGAHGSLTAIREQLWTEFKALTTISLIVSLACILCCSGVLVKPKLDTCKLLAMLFSAEAACFIALSMMSIPVFRTVSDQRSGRAQLTVTWSRFIGVLAVILQCLTSLFLVLPICICIKRIHIQKLRQQRRERRRMREAYMRILNFLFGDEDLQSVVYLDDNTKNSLEYDGTDRSDMSKDQRNVKSVSTVCDRTTYKSQQFKDTFNSGFQPVVSGHLATLPSYDEISCVRGSAT